MTEGELVQISSAELKAKRAAVKPAFGAKQAFILAQPSERPAAEVVVDGAKQGLAFNDGYVHTVRMRARKASSEPPKRRGRKPKHASESAPRSTPTSLVKMTPAPFRAGPHSASLEATFVGIALELGFARAEAVLKSMRARLARLL